MWEKKQTFDIWNKFIQEIQNTIIGCCYKNRIRCTKTASKKSRPQNSCQNRKFIGNKSADRIVKPKPEQNVNVRNVEVLFPSVQREKY